MILFRSLLYNLFATVWTAAVGIVGSPSFFISSSLVRAVSQIWATGLLVSLRIICGITYEIKGKLPEYPCIIASKHQSALDTLILLKISKQPAFVVKKELRFLPVVGLYLTFGGMIFVDRGKKYSAMKKVIAAAKTVISRKRQIIIFPEGTRNKIGQKVKYQRGIALLYAEKVAPVVPVRLNTGLVWTRNSFVKRPGRVSIEFMSPMPQDLKSGRFMQELEAVIEGKETSRDSAA
jgi:1-acyl-sn-glycerol-3-phosphate acyltransferase